MNLTLNEYLATFLIISMLINVILFYCMCKVDDERERETTSTINNLTTKLNQSQSNLEFVVNNNVKLRNEISNLCSKLNQHALIKRCTGVPVGHCPRVLITTKGSTVLHEATYLGDNRYYQISKNSVIKSGSIVHIFNPKVMNYNFKPEDYTSDLEIDSIISNILGDQSFNDKPMTIETCTIKKDDCDPYLNSPGILPSPQSIHT